MKIEIFRVGGTLIAEVISDTILIKETQDAVDLLGESNFLGAWKIIIHEKNLIPEFFDLKSGIAGDILQKFSNYKTQLAIVGDFSKYPGKNFRDFISESNKHGHIIFVNSTEEAREKLLK